jgi:MraZ protein
LSKVNYWGQVVEMDGQGRLLIPQLLREAGRLKGEVAVSGYQTYLEVRNMEAYQQKVREEKFTSDDEKTLDELGI